MTLTGLGGSARHLRDLGKPKLGVQCKRAAPTGTAQQGDGFKARLQTLRQVESASNRVGTARRMIICLGPVCVPVHLLLAFLVGLAHQHGYMKWFKREWVMYSWWLQQCKRMLGREVDAVPVVTQPQAGQGTATVVATQADGTAADDDPGSTSGACCSAASAPPATAESQAARVQPATEGGSLRSRVKAAPTI